MILGIPGSLRARSTNRAVLREAASVLHDAGAVLSSYTGLAEVPPFDEDREEVTPTAVSDLRERVHDARGVVIATPEYNGGIPGQLKNALDWLSRPTGAHVLVGKPVTVLSASPSRFGAVRAREATESVLTSLGARVVPSGWALPHAHDAVAEDGGLRDPADRLALGLALEAFLVHVPDLESRRALVATSDTGC